MSLDFDIKLKGAPGVIFAVCLVLFAVYRATPYTPDEQLTNAVSEHLLRTFNNGRIADLKRIVSAKDEQAAELFTEQMVNARVEYDLIRARGPLVPSFSSRSTIVHVKYRIVAGDEILEEQDAYHQFRKPLGLNWYHKIKSSRLIYLLYPF